ncbi:MAG TPA: tape measure protein [Ureibacillus sp.]|nr:tape measure protein [Ureibacillus sp.]
MASNTGSPRLEISIDAITTGLKKGLEDARKELKNFNDEVKRGGSPDLKNALQAEKVALAQSKTEAQQARTAIAQLALAKKQGQSATVALSGSYREAQQRLSALGRSIREAQGGFTNTTPAIRAQISEYNKLNAKLKEFDKQMGLNYRNVGNYPSAFLDAIPGISQFTTAVGLMGTAIAGLQKSFSTNLRLDSLYEGLKVASGSAEAFEKNVSFLRETSERLGLTFSDNIKAFKNFYASATGANISAEDTRRIFESVANAGAKLRLSSDDVTGALRALEQMASKGKVQAEELRGQLGERLPRAFELAAKAMGVTTAELNKMLEDGKVMSDVFLPKFAIELDKAFGNDSTKKIEGMQASIGRMNTALDNLWESEKVKSWFTEAIDGVGELASEINKLINSNSGKQFWGRFWDKDYDAKRQTVLQSSGFSGMSTNEQLDRITKQTKYVAQLGKQLGANDIIYKSQLNVLNEMTKQYASQFGKVTDINKVVEDTEKKTKKSGKTPTNTSDILGDLAGTEGNDYDKRIAKINQEYTKLVEKIRESVGSQADISKALNLAGAKRDIDTLKVSVDRYTDALKKNRGITGKQSVSLSGSLNAGSLPLLARNQERLNRPITSNLTDEFSKQFTSTLRRGLASTFNDLFSNISNLSEGAYEIEKKYADLRANATAEQIAGLNKMEALERKINNGLTNMLSKLGSTFTSISGNILSSALSNAIADPEKGLSDLKKMFSGDNKASGYGSIASLLGGALGSVFKPSDTVGQSLSGALAGLGSGVAIGTMIGGPLGTILGGVGGALIGGLTSLFGANKRKREEELAELQLAEQRKLVVLAERQNALAYQSSIIGQMINGGMVTAIERDAFGNLETTINGDQIRLVLDRSKSGRG